MKKYFASILVAVAIILPPGIRASGQLANVEYVHLAIEQASGISIPWHPAVSSKQVANLEYLLSVIDMANLEAGKLTQYRFHTSSMKQAVNTTAVHMAIDSLLAADPENPRTPGSVILMIGDGMGINHVNCSGGYISTLPVSAWVSTDPADCTQWWCITDSAAATTAYSCGIKTNNNFLAMNPSKIPCETVAQRAARAGYRSVIASNDSLTGATPAAFFAHTTRHEPEVILEWLALAPPMITVGSLVSPAAYTEQLISQYNSGEGENGLINGKPFFWMIEEAAIDWTSHYNDLPAMLARMDDFNDAVQAAVAFVGQNPEITLIIAGDHETGGLTENCVFTDLGHTGVDVPLYAFGEHAALFTGGVIPNDEVGRRIRRIIFP
ncbi:MAG: alkaline phosphatase [Alphaproteobacteria bacterium]|nr:alkaline phosphatase [Alphaproteobacteria bacterium]